MSPRLIGEEVPYTLPKVSRLLQTSVLRPELARKFPIHFQRYIVNILNQLSLLNLQFNKYKNRKLKNVNMSPRFK